MEVVMAHVLAEAHRESRVKGEVVPAIPDLWV